MYGKERYGNCVIKNQIIKTQVSIEDMFFIQESVYTIGNCFIRLSQVSI